MRNLLHRLLRRPRHRHHTLLASLAHQHTPTTARPPLRPAQIRNQRFTLTPFGQRGLDPDEVYEFLHRIATDLANANAAADQGRAEATRIKNALRRWQTEQFNQRHPNHHYNYSYR